MSPQRPHPAVSAADILELTRSRFPSLAGAPLKLEPLEKGGSDRRFYRISAPGHESLIFVLYGQQKAENRHYVEIAGFLKAAGVRVPEMHAHDTETGRIWMEDLGEKDLWSFRMAPWTERQALYQATLREVRRMHTAATRHPGPARDLELQPAFNEELYRWEQDYFFTNCLGRHFGVDVALLAQERSRLDRLASELAALPRVLVHRDFQSQNIVIKNGLPCFIDFQGMRFGLPQYDLASLLLDPYVALADSEREALLDYYLDLMSAEGSAADAADFKRAYVWCAAQRLMQALGAYGFLGHEKGRAEFLAHIPVALPRLLELWMRIEGLESLSALTAGAAERAGLRVGSDASTN